MPFMPNAGSLIYKNYAKDFKECGKYVRASTRQKKKTLFYQDSLPKESEKASDIQMHGRQSRLKRSNIAAGYYDRYEKWGQYPQESRGILETSVLSKDGI